MDTINTTPAANVDQGVIWTFTEACMPSNKSDLCAPASHSLLIPHDDWGLALVLSAVGIGVLGGRLLNLMHEYVRWSYKRTSYRIEISKEWGFIGLWAAAVALVWFSYWMALDNSTMLYATGSLNLLLFSKMRTLVALIVIASAPVFFFCFTSGLMATLRIAGIKRGRARTAFVWTVSVQVILAVIGLTADLTTLYLATHPKH